MKCITCGRDSKVRQVNTPLWWCTVCGTLEREGTTFVPVIAEQIMNLLRECTVPKRDTNAEEA